MTNFERITKSPESLAKAFFEMIQDTDTCRCPAFYFCYRNGGEDGKCCVEAITEWLKCDMQKG